jgi:hypothetical protein
LYKAIQADVAVRQNEKQRYHGDHRLKLQLLRSILVGLPYEGAAGSDADQGAQCQKWSATEYSALSPNNVLRRAIFPACERLGLPRATWLTFRRTYSSWSHDKGVPGKVVAQLMGHANVDTTLNVYTQVLDGSLRAAADKVGSELFTIVHKPEETGSRALADPGGETRISHERA